MSIPDVPIIPHLAFSQKSLDELYPSMGVAEAADDDDDGAGEEEDGLLDYGMKMAKDIEDRAACSGRRRVERPWEFVFTLECTFCIALSNPWRCHPFNVDRLKF